VLVEGTARSLDPGLDIWTIAEPVVGPWIRQEAGPLGRLEQGRETLAAFTEALERVPRILADTEAILEEQRLSRAKRGAYLSRPMVHFAYWLAVLTALAVLLRIIF